MSTYSARIILAQISEWYADPENVKDFEEWKRKKAGAQLPENTLRALPPLEKGLVK